MSSDVIGVLVRRMGGSYVVTFFLNGHPILPITNVHSDCTTNDGDDGGGGGLFESIPYSACIPAEYGVPIATASLRGDGTSLLAAFDTLDFRYPPPSMSTPTQ